MSKKKVFISHGHDQLSLLKLRTFLKETLHCEPVILSEMPDDGLTIVEKLERYGRECSFAIIILTGDDVTQDGGFRARQNVIHELGFFHGVIGRSNVLLCKEVGVELFTNISGLIYKEFERGKIEHIFEAIRKSIESASAGEFADIVPIFAEKVNVQSLFDELNGTDKSTMDRLNIIQQIAETKEPDSIYYLREMARGKGDFAIVERWAAEGALEAIKNGLDVPNLAEYAMGRIPELPQDVGDSNSMEMIALKIFYKSFFTDRKELARKSIDGILSMLSNEGDTKEKREDLGK